MLARPDPPPPADADDYGLMNQVPSLPRIRATPFVWRAPNTFPCREFVVGRHAIRGFVSVTGAASGTCKTTLLIAEFLALTSGRELLGEHIPSSGRAWYLGLEDPIEEYERRIIATMGHHGIKPGDIEDRLFVDSGRDQNFIIAKEDRGGVTIAEPIVDAIIDEIRRKRVDWLVVDPFVASHQVDESSNSKIEVVARQWARIAQRTGVAVELVHHLRKGGGVSGDPSADELRGASALVAAARSVRIIVGMSKDEAEKAGVLDERWRYFAVRSVKANLAPRSEVATWRRLATFSMNNGSSDRPPDEIGVVESWRWPDALDDISASDLRRVQQAIAAGKWRENSQSSEWAGKAVAQVLGMDAADKAARSKISSMLRIWVSNDALRIVERRDEARRMRQFIEVGEWAD